VAVDLVRGAAVDRGFTKYNQTTGEWQWKENNDISDD
jgi:hypothetical protein